MPNPNASAPTPDADDLAPDAAAAPAPAPDEVDVEEQALAALDEALADPVDGGAPVGDPAKPAGEEGKAADTPAEGDPAKTDKPAGEQKPDGEPKKPEPDKATEDEIAALGLKEKSATRFRELAGEVKTLAPIKEAIEKAGIKDVAELPQIVQDASAGREIFAQIQETGANPEQYGMALDYLSTVTRAMRGDMKAAEQAYAVMSGELTVLAKLLGKDVPGIVDPLADHADLKSQVDNGDLPRETALEMVRLRQEGALRAAHQRSETERQTNDAAQQQALQQAAADLDTLGQELAKIDPHYAVKAPVLIAQLQALKDVLPPAQWTAKARALYAAIPNPPAAPAAAPAPASARPTPGPVRGVGMRPAIAPVTDDPFEALEQGIAEANGATWSG